jgi:hypothetical protein
MVVVVPGRLQSPLLPFSTQQDSQVQVPPCPKFTGKKNALTHEVTTRRIMTTLLLDSSTSILYLVNTLAKEFKLCCIFQNQLIAGSKIRQHPGKQFPDNEDPDAEELQEVDLTTDEDALEDYTAHLLQINSKKSSQNLHGK